MLRDLSIHALGPQGDGIHRAEDGAIFVARALPGDVVRADVRRGAGGVLRGEIVALRESSTDRAPPPCRHYEACGGCTLQHATESYYRRWKVEIVEAALRKEGLDAALQPPILQSPVFLPPGGRRRVTFAAVRRKGGVTLGYFRRRSHEVTDVSECLTAEPTIMDLRAALGPALAPILHDGRAADIFLQRVGGSVEMAITGPVGRKGVPDLQVHEAVGELAHSLAIHRVVWRLRERDAPEILLAVAPVRARFGLLTVDLPPLAFLQPTQAGEETLVAAVLRALPASGTFADLFAGCGTFTGAMLERGPVDAFEMEPAAVAAQQKARGSTPLQAATRDLFRDPVEAAALRRYDAVVFDPPRAGAQAQAKVLAAAAVPRVVAVSCHPSSFARDARILVDGGYRMETLTIVDQFTWSHHVELVASFSKA